VAGREEPARKIQGDIKNSGRGKVGEDGGNLITQVSSKNEGLNCRVLQKGKARGPI